MNDEELRTLIRAAIQKHMSASAHEVGRASDAVSISFGQYQLERAKDDTSCLIEPAVQCNHCGFCKCHGH
jgi:hypothetical protein